MSLVALAPLATTYLCLLLRWLLFDRPVLAQQQVDRVGVIYYDRDIMKKAAKAGCCSPSGTHMSPCPTCFDMCGEGLVLYGANCCSRNLTQLPGAQGMCCCRSFTIVQGLDDCEQLAKAIDDGRQTAMARINAPGQGAP